MIDPVQAFATAAAAVSTVAPRELLRVNKEEARAKY
jgi:hypothetical protein